MEAAGGGGSGAEVTKSRWATARVSMARGSYAEYAVVPGCTVKAPDSLDPKSPPGHAAGHDGALSDTFRLSAPKGRTALVHAAARRTADVQMAKMLARE